MQRYPVFTVPVRQDRIARDILAIDAKGPYMQVDIRDLLVQVFFTVRRRFFQRRGHPHLEGDTACYRIIIIIQIFIIHTCKNYKYYFVRADPEDQSSFEVVAFTGVKRINLSFQDDIAIYGHAQVYILKICGAFVSIGRAYDMAAVTLRQGRFIPYVTAIDSKGE